MDAPARSEGWLHRTFGDGGPAFLGAIIGGVLTGTVAVSAAAIQEAGATSRLEAQQLEANRDEQAELRHDAYETYLAVADDFLYYSIDRVATCKPGTDVPLDEGQPCAVPLMTTYQRARHDVQAAVNELRRVGSDDGIAAMQMMAGALPYTVGTVSRVPEEEMPDEVLFNRGYLALRAVIKCETVPVVPSSCPTERG